MPQAIDAADPQHPPGYWIRRLQQIAVAIFLQETEGLEITPVQFGALEAMAQAPGLDQRRLAARLGLDTSTLGGVLDRLVAREWCERRAAPHDRRARLLHLSAAGYAALAQVRPRMEVAQARILSPLSAAQQRQFMQLMVQLVQANNAHSRAPTAERSRPGILPKP